MDRLGVSVLCCAGGSGAQATRVMVRGLIDSTYY